ncbi:MAG: SDR family oxidoreductase, partial [Acidobacteriota bacterium]
IEKALRDAIPLGRFADASEIANAAAYLVSPLASYVTGDCLTVDAGLWLGRGVFDIASRA